MTVLVLTGDCDPTADRVVEELGRRSVPIFRCDTSWFPGRLSLDAHLGDPGCWSGSLRTANRTVRLREVRSVWYRRPAAFRFPEGMSRPERQHAGWEAKFGLGGILMSLPCQHVNHPSREADACYKPLQLSTAAACGLTVPETLITNDPEAVRRFVGRTDRQVAVKTLGPNVIAEDELKVVYTHPLTDDDLADLRGVEVTAHLFQAWVNKDFEVRVVAVGTRLFAASIRAGSAAGRVDWRSDLEALTYEIVDVPSCVEAGIHRYLAALGLRYGAFDFAVTPDDSWVMFECNPGGQYGWIEANTGLPITAALADLLERGSS